MSNKFQKISQLTSLIKRKKEPEKDLQATIATHSNGLIVFQLNQPMQSIFLSAEEATVIAKVLLIEARRVKIARLSR
jgi:hypothetical protein